MVSFDWVQFKRMIGLNPATPMDSQEGQVRYIRDGAVDGTFYGAQRIAAGTMIWTPLNNAGLIDHHAGDHSANTASTTIYTAYLTRSVTLPAGTWTVRANGWLAMVHSAALKSTMRVTVDGTAGTARVTENLSATLYSMWTSVAGKASVSGAQSIDVVVEFHSSGVGTTTVGNGSLWISAQRTA